MKRRGSGTYVYCMKPLDSESRTIRGISPQALAIQGVDGVVSGI
jgi:hypothetical protein